MEPLTRPQSPASTSLKMAEAARRPLLLEIDVGERLPIAVADDEAASVSLTTGAAFSAESSTPPQYRLSA